MSKPAGEKEGEILSSEEESFIQRGIEEELIDSREMILIF